MKNLLFDDFRQWKVCMLAGLSKFSWGLCRMLTGILFGIVSIFVWAYRKVCAFCRREPIAATIVAILLFTMTFGWIYTFVTERHATVTAQHIADSLSYDLSRITQAYDSVIVDGDTIKFER